jgi:hypothetical protein
VRERENELNVLAYKFTVLQFCSCINSVLTLSRTNGLARCRVYFKTNANMYLLKQWRKRLLSSIPRHNWKYYIQNIQDTSWWSFEAHLSGSEWCGGRILCWSLRTVKFYKYKKHCFLSTAQVRTKIMLCIYSPPRYIIFLYDWVYSQISLLYSVSDLTGPSSGASNLHERIW